MGTQAEFACHGHTLQVNLLPDNNEAESVKETRVVGRRTCDLGNKEQASPAPWERQVEKKDTRQDGKNARVRERGPKSETTRTDAGTPGTHAQTAANTEERPIQ